MRQVAESMFPIMLLLLCMVVVLMCEREFVLLAQSSPALKAFVASFLRKSARLSARSLRQPAHPKWSVCLRERVLCVALKLEYALKLDWLLALACSATQLGSNIEVSSNWQERAV